MLRRLASTSRIGLAMMFAVLSSGLLPMAAAYAATPPNPDTPVKKITFCHATPPEDAKNGWNLLDTAPTVVFNSGHDKHAKDIIPPFTYTHQGKDIKFDGLNWDTAGKAIYENDCVDDQKVITDYFLETYHDTSMCGQITVSLRNASPWLYRVLIEEKGSGGEWNRVASSSPYSPWEVVPGVLEVDNRGNDIPDDRTGFYTVSYPEHSGDHEVRYKVSSGTESDLYDGALGQYTYVNANADCLADEEFYCNPANKPNGLSIAEWVPKDLNCVTYSVIATCGQVEAVVDKADALPYTYSVAWSQDKDNIGTSNLLPKTFPEDYNGGSVDIYYWLVGPEGDYAKDRGMYTYWDNSYGSLTIDTNCQDDETPLPSGIADICGIGNDVVPDQDTQYYTVSSDTGWNQDGNDPVKKVRTITYQANDGYKFPQTAGWTVSEDGKTASYTYTDWATPCTVVCEPSLPIIHATNKNSNGWTLGSGAKYVEGGIELTTPGSWVETTIERELTGKLRDLGSSIDFTPGAQYLGLHVLTSKGTLVYEQEPSYGGNWWSHDDFGVNSGMGYDTFDSLENIVAANPDVTLEKLTVLYTSPTPASTIVYSVIIGCVEYTFDYELAPVTPTVPITPITPTTPTTPNIPVLGAVTGEPAGPAVSVLSDYDIPEMLPQTGSANSTLATTAALLLLGLVTYGVAYFAQPRHNTDY